MTARKLREMADAFERYYYTFDFDGDIDQENPANKIVLDDLRAVVVRRLREIADALMEAGE